MPQENKFSLEKDFFPHILDQGVFAYEIEEEFIDIGTPERYTKAKNIFKKGGIK